MRTFVALVALALCMGETVASADASSAAWKKYKGQIIVADAEIPTEWGSDKDMVDGLKKANKAIVTRREGSSTWHLYFMAFLSKKPGAGMVNLVFYDVTGGKRAYVSNKEINIEEAANILASDIEISEEDGIKPGGRYELVVGRKSGGRETVFARTKLTLK